MNIHDEPCTLTAEEFDYIFGSSEKPPQIQE